MATSVSLRESHGEQYIVVVADVTVTYAATYYVKYVISPGGTSQTTESFTLGANGSTATAAVTFTGLSPGTTYTITGYLYNAATGGLGITDTITVTTLTSVTTSVSANLVSVGENYITVNFSGIVKYAATYTIEYGIEETGETRVTGQLSLSARDEFSTNNATFTGLMPGTKYTVWCSLWNYDAGTELGVTDEISITTDRPPRPNDWYWTSVVQSGAEMPITKIGDKVYQVMPLTAAEWNNFTARINEFRYYTGLSDYSFTTVYKGGGITAAQLNQARTAISSIPGRGTLPTAASSNGTATASFVNGLKNALNAVP